jgi:YebC/PmpR family DNA-binding regulatory protein
MPMSGHSKWATIKRQKGANDAKRGQLFTKLSKSITLAVREGGGVADPNGNFRLRLAIEAARGANMPKDNIERAISRANGKEMTTLAAALYEGFGPGGFSVIVETLSDNNQRTVSEVKNVFDKNGGNMGNQGSVQYQFEKKGMITVAKDGRDLDEIFLIAADNQAEDVEDGGEEVYIYTQPSELARSRDGLAVNGLSVKAAELLWKPIVLNQITEKVIAEKALNFVEKLEELDDVQKVYANFDIAEEIMQEQIENE